MQTLLAIGGLALTPQSRAVDQMPRDPIAAYQFDEGSGTTTADKFGAITGTLQGPATFSSSTPFSYAGNFSLDLSAIGNDFVDLGDQASLFFPDSFSLSVWIQPSETVSNQFGTYIVSDYSASADMSSFSIRLQGTNAGANTGRAGFFWENPAGNAIIATSTTDLDEGLNSWYHIVATWDGTTRSVYVNGALEGTESTPQARADIGGNTAIGRAGSFDAQNFNFNGQIDDVAFFDYSLNADEASWLHNNSIASIPEPASFSLLAAAGATLLGSPRRRHHARR